MPASDLARPAPRGPQREADQVVVRYGTSPAPPLVFSTLDLPPAQQFDAWHASSAGTVETEPLADRASGFAATREVWPLGSLALATTRAPAARLSRNAAQARRGLLDHWMISIARHGERRVRSAEASVTLPAGAVSISSLDAVFFSERSDIEWLCLFVPREVVPEIGIALHASRDTPLESGMGRILAAYLTQLAAEVPTLDASEVPRVVESARAMIAASLVPSADAMAAAGATIDSTQISRVKALIRQNLGSAVLGPERLCRLAGVSRSRLYRMFEPHGGVAHYIQSERLRAVSRALADPMDNRTISAIAEDIGFFDSSAFSRLFRQRFGCTPRDFRIAAQAGQIVAMAQTAPEAGTSELAGLLRRL
ncbi:helix-turn-helix domain-containing protein [Falsiroseomonas oryzae]|uniref:helix-turn-helix domain-containing protein n=1 Tax=Falsiroseomonas oryzae TaxID=2766473 RepID=UPI0022EADBC0|nr:helix-turn-helix domain-containing protein [Roseomonas sp. MO-31]